MVSRRKILTGGALALGFGALFFTRMKMQPRIKPSGFGYVPGIIFGCETPGRAWHDIDLEQEFRTIYGADMGEEAGPNGGNDIWVDPVNGLDSNSGSLLHPVKTLKYAYQNVIGTVWLKPGRYTEKLDLRNTDRQLGSGQSRAIMVKAWDGLGSVIFAGAGDQPNDMTWTANGQLWQAIPSGGESAQLILYIGGEKEIPIQYKDSVTAVETSGYGWHQDPTSKQISIRYEGRDFSVDKAKFEIIYETPGNSIIFGAKVFLKDIIFRGGNEIDVVYQDAVRPIMYAQDCKFEYLAGSNIHTEGAIFFAQRCSSRRSLVDDGFNYYDSIASGSTPGGVSTQALEIDSACTDNGVPECKTFVEFESAQPRNKQGSSGHESSIVCRINGTYSGNYGQNIADTGTESQTWMVGSVCGNPFGKIGGGATFGGYYNLWTEGTAWLDTVTSGGRLVTYGLWAESGTAHLYRCGFSGTSAGIGGVGSVNDYDPLML